MAEKNLFDSFIVSKKPLSRSQRKNPAKERTEKRDSGTEEEVVRGQDIIQNEWSRKLRSSSGIMYDRVRRLIKSPPFNILYSADPGFYIVSPRFAS